MSLGNSTVNAVPRELRYSNRQNRCALSQASRRLRTAECSAHAATGLSVSARTAAKIAFHNPSIAASVDTAGNLARPRLRRHRHNRPDILIAHQTLAILPQSNISCSTRRHHPFRINILQQLGILRRNLAKKAAPCRIYCRYICFCHSGNSPKTSSGA